MHTLTIFETICPNTIDSLNRRLISLVPAIEGRAEIIYEVNLMVYKYHYVHTMLIFFARYAYVWMIYYYNSLTFEIATLNDL